MGALLDVDTESFSDQEVPSPPEQEWTPWEQSILDMAASRRRTWRPSLRRSTRGRATASLPRSTRRGSCTAVPSWTPRLTRSSTWTPRASPTRRQRSEVFCLLEPTSFEAWDSRLKVQDNRLRTSYSSRTPICVENPRRSFLVYRITRRHAAQRLLLLYRAGASRGVRQSLFAAMRLIM